MSRTRAQEVRRSKKKSQYLRELSSYLTRLAQDEPTLGQLYITRVELSPDGGMCYVYVSFYALRTEEEKIAAFDEARKLLVVYKPSLRKALADSLHSRYVPDLRFAFDQNKEKEHRVTDLLTQVGDELAAYDREHSDDDDEVSSE